MGRKRKKHLSLTGTRIFMRFGSFQYLAPEPLVDPKTGKPKRWHILCPESAGEFAARVELNRLLSANQGKGGGGNFSYWFNRWKNIQFVERSNACPDDPVRKKTWEDGTKSLRNVFDVIHAAFEDADVEGIKTSSIQAFLDQWEGRRSAQSYRAHLVKFFAWTATKDLLAINPAEQTIVKHKGKTKPTITADQYLAIQKALRAGRNNRDSKIGEMVCCYMDLLYLLHQRGIDVRMATWEDMQREHFVVTPTKTEQSSNLSVALPISPAVKQVLDRAKGAAIRPSKYIICTAKGEPYTSHGIGSIFKRACKRAGVTGVTLKDIRPMAATEARLLGYSVSDIQVALAHTDTKTTIKYIRTLEPQISTIVLSLPGQKK